MNLPDQLKKTEVSLNIENYAGITHYSITMRILSPPCDLRLAVDKLI